MKVLAVAVIIGLTSAPAFPAPPPRCVEADCLACHADEDLGVFSRSVHGQAGVGCTGCHADLAGVEDFPHPPKLQPAVCAACHGDEARGSLVGVHRLASPRLAKSPVGCKDCHGYHDIMALADESSVLSAARRPATCAKCHPRAGANYSRGRVHDVAAAGRPSPARVVGALYLIFIGVMTTFFLAYVSVDLLGARRER